MQEDQDDPATVDIEDQHGIQLKLVNGKNKITVLVTNMSGKTIKADMCEIGGGGVSVADASFSLADVTEKSTMTEVLAAYGRTVNTDYSWNDDETTNTLCYYDDAEGSLSITAGMGRLYAPGEVRDSSARYLALTFDKKSDKLVGIAMNNWVKYDPFAPSDIGKQLALEYKVPDALGTMPGNPITQIDGDLYEFPAALCCQCDRARPGLNGRLLCDRHL